MTERPRRLVLLGHPVRHSLSPLFQNAALQAAEIPLRYEALDVAPEDWTATLASLLAQRAAGNVTIPYKESMYTACARVSPVAERVGAVNTFWVEDGSLVGHNTDVGGFDAAMRVAFGIPDDPWRVAVLGAGGAAAGVLAAVERWPGATAVVTSRTPARAERVVARFARTARYEPDMRRAVAGATLVVNATPVGLHGEPGPIDPALLAAGTHVFDLVYTRGGTPWVTAARARGLPAADGLRMLVEQGALSFERWFGRAPDRTMMWAAVTV